MLSPTSTNPHPALSNPKKPPIRTKSMTDADEQHLLNEAKQGNRRAFGRLVERHMKRTYGVALRFVNDHHAAEEIVQEAFVKAYKAIGSFRGDAEFTTWLYRIVVNLSLNAAKKSKHHHLPLESATAFPLTPFRYPDEDSVRTDLIRKALTDLPALQQQVVVLRHLEGHSTREVSRILKCSEGTVKTHLFRGLKKLRMKLEFLREELA
jgi:RNA polymerase sigma-70 factor (ECF subfamily)